jgi:hypothetical protein
MSQEKGKKYRFIISDNIKLSYKNILFRYDRLLRNLTTIYSSKKVNQCLIVYQSDLRLSRDWCTSAATRRLRCRTSSTWASCRPTCTTETRSSRRGSSPSTCSRTRRTTSWSCSSNDFQS